MSQILHQLTAVRYWK